MYQCWQCHDLFDNAEILLDHLNTAHKTVEGDLWRYAGTVATNTQ
jgi:hypothetical protein